MFSRIYLISFLFIHSIYAQDIPKRAQVDSLFYHSQEYTPFIFHDNNFILNFEKGTLKNIRTIDSFIEFSEKELRLNSDSADVRITHTKRYIIIEQTDSIWRVYKNHVEVYYKEAKVRDEPLFHEKQDKYTIHLDNWEIVCTRWFNVKLGKIEIKSTERNCKVLFEFDHRSRLVDIDFIYNQIENDALMIHVKRNSYITSSVYYGCSKKHFYDLYFGFRRGKLNEVIGLVKGDNGFADLLFQYDKKGVLLFDYQKYAILR